MEQDPLQAALAAGGQGLEGEAPADHDPPMTPAHGLTPVDPDEVELECMRAIRKAARVASGATDARQIADAGAGAVAFLDVIERLNAEEEQPPPQQVPVTPHAVGMVRQALAADHGIDPADFDRMLLGAHQHLSDLEQAGNPTIGETPAPTGPESAPPSPSDLGGTIGATDQGA